MVFGAYAVFLAATSPDGEKLAAAEAGAGAEGDEEEETEEKESVFPRHWSCVSGSGLVDAAACLS